jgi:nucleoside-diphosphate-sugar epimerase
MIVSPSILVIGGGGFIGKTLVQKLLDKGYSVRLLVRNKLKIPFSTETENVELIEGNILSKATLDKALQGIETVYYLAHGSGNTWEDFQTTEVDAIQLVAESSLKWSVKQLIYTSSIDVYYAGKKGEVITEKTPLDPSIPVRNFYARAKAASEWKLNQLHQEQNLPVTIFRPGIVIGRGGSPFHIGVALWNHQGAVCQYYGKGNHPLPLVLVDDVADALIASMKQQGIAGESFNLIGPQLMTAQEYVAELSKALQMRINAIETPIWHYFSTDVGKWIVKCVARSSNRKLPSYHDWSSRTQSAFFDCSKARQILQWHPVDNRDVLILKGIKEPAKEWID